MFTVWFGKVRKARMGEGAYGGSRGLAAYFHMIIT